MKTLFFTLLYICLFGQLVQAQCNAYYTLKEGVRYEYETYDRKDKLNGRIAQTFTNTRNSGNVITTTLKQEVMDIKKNTPLSQSESEWTCTDGTLHFSLNSMFMSSGDAQMSMAEGITMDLTGDQLDLPSQLQVGSDLKDVNYHVKMMMNQLAILDRSFTIKDRKVEGEETITTPAGTFKCIKLTSTTESKGRMGGSTIKSAVWYAEEVGMVKTENYKEDGKLISRMVLAKID